MKNVSDLAINLLAAAIAFGLGYSVRMLANVYRARRGRRFWGAGMGAGSTVLFLGSFSQDAFGSFSTDASDKAVFRSIEFEPTGMVGLGDTRAVHELTAALSKLGIDVKMAYTNDKAAGQTRSNVILLGAEEVNPLVDGPFRVPTTLIFDAASKPLTLKDILRNTVYQAKWNDGDVTVDYGKLVRVVNPYAPDRTLVTISGIYGYGTWGGVQLLRNPVFLKRCAELETFDLECVYMVQVHRGAPEFVTPIDVRALPVSVA